MKWLYDMRPRYLGKGYVFACHVWSKPRKTTRLHETCYAFGPFRYTVWGGLLRR